MSQNKTSYDFFYLFRDVMRSGSYQKAARDSGCTVSAISQKISQMEKELGIDLFEEGSDGMAPTAAGLFLYDKLDTVLWNLDSIVQQARSNDINASQLDEMANKSCDKLAHIFSS